MLCIAALLVGLVVLVPLGCGGSEEAGDAADAPRTVRDLDNYRCAGGETQYGRCPNNPYFGKTMAEARAAKKADAKRRRAEAAAEERAAAAEAAREQEEAEREYEAEQAALEAENAWIPDGWNQYSGSENIYWQWNDECDNSYVGCFGMDVVTKYGCDDLYVEVLLLDPAGNAVGNSNDTIGALGPGQVAKLDFSNYEEAETVRLGEISCY